MHSDEDFKSFYDNEYHGRRHSTLLEDDEYFWARAEASAKLNFVGIEPGAKILEYGCGIGQNIATLPNAHGYDVSADARVSYKRRGIMVFEDVAEIPRESFDVILSRHVLEHVPYPLETLRLMREMLKPGGTLIMILPKEKHSMPPSFELDLNRHLHCWNFRAINNLLALSGYRVVANYYQYVVGYRRLLPLKRLFGFWFYYQATLIAGRIFGVGELVVRAVNDGAQEDNA